MEPFRLCVALGPLAIYLAVLAIINLRRRASVVGGGRDTAALAIGLSGLLLVGPIELLFPKEAIARLGPILFWSLLLVLYALSLALVALLVRPRLAIYNVSLDELRPILAETAAKLDLNGRWAGNSVFLPAIQVELHVDAAPNLRNVSLVASGQEQSYQGWRKLEGALAARLRGVPVRRNRFGYLLLLAAALMLARVAWQVAARSDLVASSFRELLRS